MSLSKRKRIQSLPPPRKKRKSTSAIEEISFDPAARADYLTGFHKRKLQRIKHAKDEAAKREREERITARKLVRLYLLLFKDGEIDGAVGLTQGGGR